MEFISKELDMINTYSTEHGVPVIEPVTDWWVVYINTNLYHIIK